jgi:hypothetical protein
MIKAHQARSGSTSFAVLASLHNATEEIDGVRQGLFYHIPKIRRQNQWKKTKQKRMRR